MKSWDVLWCVSGSKAHSAQTQMGKVVRVCVRVCREGDEDSPHQGTQVITSTGLDPALPRATSGVTSEGAANGHCSEPHCAENHLAPSGKHVSRQAQAARAAWPDHTASAPFLIMSSLVTELPLNHLPPPVLLPSLKALHFYTSRDTLLFGCCLDRVGPSWGP